METFDKMMEAVNGIWDDYNNHPFVQGIADGSLDREKFKYYMIQDYLYLKDYLKVFSIGTAKSNEMDLINLFGKYVNLLIDFEMNIHRGYVGKLGISNEELNNTKMSIDNISYTSCMLRYAYEEGPAEILAAILSCSYSYEVIAKKILENNPNATKDNYYDEWILGYASDEYSSGNVSFIKAINELTKNYTDKQIQHLIDIFVLCSKHEMRFWDMSWETTE